jgi:hypothetical protein
VVRRCSAFAFLGPPYLVFHEPRESWRLFAGFFNFMGLLDHHSFSGFPSFSRPRRHEWAVLLLVIVEIGLVGLLVWFAVKLLKDPFV